MQNSNPKKIVFVVGPTASGKSHLGSYFQKTYGGGIINFDSLQVYQSLDIGTAKPSKQEIRQSPHYLFDCIPEGEDLTAGGFCRKAQEVLATEQHTLFWGVGGSGFYINALVKGMYEETPVKDQVVDELLEYKAQHGGEGLFQRLQEVDPEYAAQIHKNDQYRVLRGLQLVLSLGKSMAQIREEFASKKSGLEIPFMFLGVRVDREVLRDRVRSRLDKMLADGFLSEVEELLKRNLGGWKPMQSVGYKEAVMLLQGAIDRPTFVEEVVKNTMRLAKRQMTWFRKVEGVHWVDSFDEAIKNKELLDFIRA